MLEATEGCRRSQALAEKIGTTADAVLCTSPENIYFFTGFRTMLCTRFSGALIRMDQPAEPILIAARIDRGLVKDRIWSPPWGSRVVYHGAENLPDVAPAPAAAMTPPLVGVRRRV